MTEWAYRRANAPESVAKMEKLDMRRFHHVGVITDEQQPGEIYVAQTKVHVTQLFSLRETAIVKERGPSYFKPWRCVSRLGLMNGGLDSLESSPYVTLSRGAFSASSLVTPTR